MPKPAGLLIAWGLWGAAVHCQAQQAWPGASAPAAASASATSYTLSQPGKAAPTAASGAQTAPPMGAMAATAPANTTPPKTADNTDNHADPVLNLLAEKGLLPRTEPVAQLALQVRDKASDMASDLVMSAMNFLGVPYRRGGTSETSGFDCSGFTRRVFENSIGLILPRRAIEQANSPELVAVKKSELKPGDLVFFNTLRHAFSHVGIYIGDDKFIHAPRTGGEVRVEDMRQAYWQRRFDGARRAPSVAAQSQVAAQAVLQATTPPAP